MRLAQLLSEGGERLVVATLDDGTTRRVRSVDSSYALAMKALAARTTVASLIAGLGFDEELSLRDALEEQRILAPIEHPDPAHLWLSGTGLTHLGSADARDRMHAKGPDSDASDSMKMFLSGVEGGKASGPAPGVQPEWFYKGNGNCVVGPEASLTSPHFALDAGEEPEVAGIYLIGSDGTPFRLGFTLANEFSDHVMERKNYLYLAHSKLRPASLGPEILLGDLPEDIRGSVRIRRGAQTLWARDFLTGEKNMSHHVRNLEYHHFKYDLFRHPGDVHVHFFGTATLSFADGIKAVSGDVFEIEAAPFGLPLRNALRSASARDTTVHGL